jgi:hypothetical protein
MKPDVALDRLHELLAYNPSTGELTRKVSRGGVRAGSRAGHIELCRSGGPRPGRPIAYRKISVDGKSYRSGRLAYFWMTGVWPVHQIDHRDTDSLNDAFRNLRPATHSQSCANQHKLKPSGLPRGVYKHRRRFSAQIQVDGVRHHLGTFDTPSEAAAAYNAAAIKYHGEFPILNELPPLEFMEAAE